MEPTGTSSSWSGRRRAHVGAGRSGFWATSGTDAWGGCRPMRTPFAGPRPDGAEHGRGGLHECSIRTRRLQRIDSCRCFDRVTRTGLDQPHRSLPGRPRGPCATRPDDGERATVQDGSSIQALDTGPMLPSRRYVAAVHQPHRRTDMTSTDGDAIRTAVRDRYAEAAPPRGTTPARAVTHRPATASAPRCTTPLTSRTSPRPQSPPPSGAATPLPWRRSNPARSSWTSGRVAGSTFCCPPAGSAPPARCTAST